MNHRLIEALMMGIAPVIKEHIDGAMSAIRDRLKNLESRDPVKGEKGDSGEAGKDGVDGKDGAHGRDGVDGKDGAPGLDGKDGAPGLPGAPGERGLPGEKGLDGKDGRDGQPGGPGSAGRDGSDGKDGAPGLNGKDGLGFDDIQVEHDGERGFIFRFVRGDQVKEFGKFTVPVTIYRGVWKEGEFQRGDEVTWGGSQFIAKRDTKSKPEINDDWQLACKRGRDGKDGKNGERGLQGLEGKPGRDGRQF